MGVLMLRLLVLDGRQRVKMLPEGQHPLHELRRDAEVVLRRLADRVHLLRAHLLEVGVKRRILARVIPHVATRLTSHPREVLRARVRLRVAEGSQHDVEGLPADQVTGHVEVPLHVVVDDHQGLHGLREPPRRVGDVGGDLREGTAGGRVGEVALVLADAVEVDGHHASQHVLPHGDDVLVVDRVLLVRHGGRAVLLRARLLADLGDLAALQLAHVVREVRLDPRDQHELVEHARHRLRRHDLRRDHGRFHTTALEHRGLERERIVHDELRGAVNANRSRELPAQVEAQALQVLHRATETVDVAGDHEPEGDRRTVLAVRTPGLAIELVAIGEPAQHYDELQHPRDLHVVDELPEALGVRGVERIVARRREVHEPLRGIAHLLHDPANHGPDVVLRELLLDVVDRREIHLGARRTDLVGDGLRAVSLRRELVGERGLELAEVAVARTLGQVVRGLGLPVAVVDRRDGVEGVEEAPKGGSGNHGFLRVKGRKKPNIKILKSANKKPPHMGRSFGGQSGNRTRAVVVLQTTAFPLRHLARAGIVS